MAIRPEGPILVDFSARSAGFSAHIQLHSSDTAEPNIHIQWSTSPVISLGRVSLIDPTYGFSSVLHTKTGLVAAEVGPKRSSG